MSDACRACGDFSDWADSCSSCGAKTVQGEAERLLSYWERHGDSPEAVSKWAVCDLLEFVRFVIAEGQP
jgi:hypothetical protein